MNNIQVLYHSKGGNTQLVAVEMGKALKRKAMAIDKIPSPSKVRADLLLIGDGTYFGGISKEMKKFISELDKERIRCAAVFSTSGSGSAAGANALQKQLRERGITVADETYHCHGAVWGIFYATHPDMIDLDRAWEFAKKMQKEQLSL